MKLVYTPISSRGIIQEDEVLETDEFENLEEIFDLRIKQNLKFYEKNNGDCIMRRLGMTSYIEIERLRRSPQWHREVHKYTDDPVIIMQLTLPMQGRR